MMVVELVLFLWVQHVTPLMVKRYDKLMFVTNHLVEYI